jgi:hypothetical protein
MAHERQTRDSNGQDSTDAQAIIVGHYENMRTARKELSGCVEQDTFA